MIIPWTTRRLPRFLAARHIANCSAKTSMATTTTASATANGQQQHQMNINHALKKSDEELPFQTLSDLPITTLQGIGPKHATNLSTLGLTTVRDLADYRFFHLARSIAVLARTEEAGGRKPGTALNLDKGLDKEFEGCGLKE